MLAISRKFSPSKRSRNTVSRSAKLLKCCEISTTHEKQLKFFSRLGGGWGDNNIYGLHVMVELNSSFDVGVGGPQKL